MSYGPRPVALSAVLAAILIVEVVAGATVFIGRIWLPVRVGVNDIVRIVRRFVRSHAGWLAPGHQVV